MTTPKIDEELETACETFINDVTPKIYELLEKADITYSDDQICLCLEDGFKAGAKFQEERSRKEFEKLKQEKQVFRGAISEVICHSYDVMAKKVCSRALAEVEGINE